MQYSLVTAMSTVLLASAVTSAGVVQRRQATPMTTFLTVKTGDGDAAAGTSINVGSLQTTDTNGRPISGCTGTIGDAGISCQAFSDANGQTKLGNIFNSVTTGIWSDKCDGSTASVATDAVQLGSFCCADSLRFDKVCLGNQNVAPPTTDSSSSNNNNNNNNNNDNGQNVGNAIQEAGSTDNDPWEGHGHHEEDFPVNIQLSGLDELAVQNEIDTNGQPQPVRNAVGITNIFILHSHKQVICEAFAGGQAIPNSQFMVGSPANLDPAGVNVDAVSCKIA